MYNRIEYYLQYNDNIIDNNNIIDNDNIIKVYYNIMDQNRALKVIQFNPKLLSVPGGNKTRKNKPKGKTIQYKKKELTNKTTKQKLLRYIREQQDQNYKKLFEKPATILPKINIPDNLDIMKANGDFENSLNYLKSITDNYENNKEKKSVNHTIKHHPQPITHPPTHPPTHPLPNNTPTNYYYGGAPNNGFIETTHINNVLPDVFNDITTNQSNHPAVSGGALRINSQFKLPPVPKYGCMRIGGKLPTLKQYMNNQTFKGGYNQTTNHHPPSNPHLLTHHPPANAPTHHQSNQSNHRHNKPSLLTDKDKEILYIARTMGKKKEIVNNKAAVNKLRYLKQKKTLTRTYKVGKSKTKPEVSVLISNKTIRNTISSKSQLLKQIPIHDVKQFLIKKGFIKVGSSAPIDVLRKMYESAILIGGEINNFNSENLLFNFFNNDGHN